MRPAVRQKRMRTFALNRISAAAQGCAAIASSLVRSNAWGRSGPSNDDHPVGGCLWWKKAAGPKKPSLLISRS